jgi:glycosyltransferase involved in cell wall biosynthesis
MRKVLDGDIDVAIIPNGVDFTLFRPLPRAEIRAELGWRPDGFYILFGNDPALYRKGFTLAQDALACLKLRGLPAELVVANGLPQTQLVRYLNACNALILPSLIEGSPNVVKEAMACNVPVVSSDVGDVSFADALELAWQHTEPTTGRHDIAHLEHTVVAQQVIAVYQQALARKTKGHPSHE